MSTLLTDQNSIDQRKIVGLENPAWRGYDGKGITVYHNDIEDNGHNRSCKAYWEFFLPQIRVLSGHMSYSAKSGKITSCTINCFETNERLPLEEFIVKYNVSQMNDSTGIGDQGDEMDSPLANYFKELIVKYNLFCTGAAGNFGGMTNRFQGAFILVSGLILMPDGSWKDYGSAGTPVDFSMFMGNQFGTSFAGPFLNYLGTLLRIKYGREITQPEIYEYFMNRCSDLGIEGRDPCYGWGLPIMPDIKKELILNVGDDFILFNGEKISIDQPAIINPKTNRTLTPLRATHEAMGDKVTWFGKDKKIVITREE